MLGLPLQCSIFVTKHEGALAKANGVQADYLFQPDKHNAGADLGDRTIPRGRKADALKIWLAWKHRGDDGFSDLVDRAFGLADAVQQDVSQQQADDGSFVLAAEAQCANAGFWYVPPRLRPFDPATATANQLTEIGFVAPKLKDAMQRAGDAMIGFQPIDSMNKPNFFRLVLPPTRVTCPRTGCATCSTAWTSSEGPVSLFHAKHENTLERGKRKVAGLITRPRKPRTRSFLRAHDASRSSRGAENPVCGLKSRARRRSATCDSKHLKYF